MTKQPAKSRQATRPPAASDPGLEATLKALAGEVARLSRQVAEMHALIGPFGVPMPGGRMLVQSMQHIKYLIDPRDLVMAPQLIVYRQWEPELTALFGALLGPRSVFVDVGANFGYFTCLAGTLIGAAGDGRVFAVEPNPSLLDLLRANAAINWSMCPIKILPVAAAATAGRATLSIPVDGAANASLSSGAGVGPVTEVTVDLLPLDSMIPPGLPVDVLKIDVEGHEMGVLLGAERTLRDSPDIKVIMEWSQQQISEAGYSGADLLAVADRLGLATFEAPADGRPSDWAPLPKERLLSIPYANIILTHATTS